MNLSMSGMFSSVKHDVVNRQLSRSANANGRVYDPTSSAQKSNHETDKQAEENATWFFEYKALLNSKLTTLTTALTSAYTTDLDSSMSDTSWGKNAMQGLTGSRDNPNDNPKIDPGAARTAVSYFKKYGFAPTYVPTPSGQDIYGTASTLASNTASFTMTLAGATATIPNPDAPDPNPWTGVTNAVINQTISGTTTFLSGGSGAGDAQKIVLDQLLIHTKDSRNNKYVNNKDGFAEKVEEDDTTTISNYKDVGNQFEKTLFKFFSKPENYDLLKFGFFDNLYIVGTSSLATGSQVQGSIKLEFDKEKYIVKIVQERFSAFFHT